MSWNIYVASQDKDVVKRLVEANAYAPRAAKDMIVGMVDALKLDQYGNTVVVDAGGHHDATYGNARVDVKRIVVTPPDAKDEAAS